MCAQTSRTFLLCEFQPIDECLRLLGEVICEQACGARMEPIVAVARQKLADLSVRAQPKHLILTLENPVP